MFTIAIGRLVGQLKKQHMRRRFVEKTLHKLGISRSRSIDIARRIP